MKEQILKEYGLSDKEAKVYLAALQLGSSTAHQIAKKSSSIRTTTYDVLKSLIEKGLVSYVIKNRMKYFESADPSKLISILEEKKKKIERLLPELNELKQSATEKPKVELYEGKEGIKTIMQDLLKTKKPVVSFSNTHNILSLLKFFVPQFIEQRKKAGIRIRLLTEKSKETMQLMKKKDKTEKRETRFLPAIEKVPNTVYIYGKKVAILNTTEKEPVGILVENEDYANTMRILFEDFWKKAK